MKYKIADAKIRIVPIFLVIITVLALTISSEIDKRIDIKLDFSNATNYDLNNDGTETTKGIVDLAVKETQFTWDINQEKIMTKWTVENLDKKTKIDVCYGNEEGCLFIGLPSSSKNWDDILYVNYGKDGAGFNNKVLAQVIYYDVNISVPYSEIYYSLESEKEVKFYEKDPAVLSNLDVEIKNKEGLDIGHYEIKESEDGYDLVISNKKEERTAIRTSSQDSQVQAETKAVIKDVQNVGEIVAVIDQDLSDETLNTDVIAVDDTNLLFEVAEVTLTKRGEVNAVLRCEDFNFETFECSNWQKTEIPFVDDGSTIRFNVTGFSAYAGAEIEIINVHSYPPLYGNWTVMFNTTGTANLTIRAINGTTWSNIDDVGSGYDLKFLEIMCGEKTLPYEWRGNSVFIENYSCNETGYETQKELTTGNHYLEFEYGNAKAYAFNDVVGAISISSSIIEKGSSAIATSSGDCTGGWDITVGSTYCSLSYSSCSATITGIAVGTCTVRVRNSTLDGAQTAQIIVQDTTPPANNMKVNASDYPRDQWENGIQVSWNRSSATDVVLSPANYTLRRAVNMPQGGDVIFVVKGTNLSAGTWTVYDHPGYDTNIAYYYGVVACDDSGNCNNGVWSNAVHINALPIQNSTWVEHIDGVLVAGDNRTGSQTTRVATANDTIKCVGTAYDKDNESLSMTYNITILETYGRGDTTKIDGVLTDCIYFDHDVYGWQNKYNLSVGHTLCEYIIDSSLLSKGDKVDCVMKPYDQKEYGDPKSSQTAYINNSRPFASNVFISPSNPNESTTLKCNYTFNDPDCYGGVCDTENTSASLFKWFINNEGLNDFIEIPGQTSRDLGIDYFDKDDVVMCSVMVKDIDDGWLFSALYDDEYVNSSSIIIRDNAKPQIINFSDNSNFSNPTTEGQDVVFTATWVDYEDPGEIAQIYVCNNNLEAEIPDETGKGTLTIGAGNSTILYTNLAGQYVETIAIKANASINSSGSFSGLNRSTGFVYDVYAFEVDNIGDPIPAFDQNNMSTYPIAEDHNNAFMVGKWNYIKLQYNSQPLVGKRLAIVFCIDDNDNNHIYCGSDISTGNETLYIRASSTEVNSNINITNRTGSNVGSYSNASIVINYRATEDGRTADKGCVGARYCYTDLSATSTVSCSYTIKSTDPQQSNNYYMKACDDGGQCSVWRQGSFFVNHKAIMNAFNLTTGGGTNFTDDSNLNCSQNNGTDDWVKDYGTLSYTYKWYLDRNTGIFTLFPTAPDSQILSHANTQTGDRWICEVIPNDGFSDGFPRNSSNIAYIGINPVNGYNANGTPYILNATANSDHNNPSTEGSTVTMTINWSDSNSTSINKIYICNSSSVTTTGCLDYQFASYGSTSSNVVNVGFTANPLWSENQTAHIFVYDDTWLISPEYNVSFVINHRPNATNVRVDYITASSLTCTYTFNDSKDTLDSENTTLAQFKWWMDGTEQAGLTTKNITGVSIPTHTWICGVKVYDNHGLASSAYLNSTTFYGTSSIITPIIWSLPEAVPSDNRTENNVSTINLIGYINRSNINITAVAKQNDDIKINSISNGSANSTLLGTGYLYTGYAKGSSYIRVSESYSAIFTAGRFLEFASHNKTYFTRYSITSQTYLYDGTYRININPNLEAAVSDNERIYVYDLEKPSGWFNLTLNLFNGSNEVKVRGYENVSSTWLTGLFTTFTIYYDNQTPIVNVSAVPTASNNNSHNISFSIADDFKVNMSTLLINISNATFNITHRYDSLFYNQTWNWGTNISCSGNNTNKDCTVLLNLPNGNYSLNFSVNDSVGNYYSATINNYLVDSTRPNAPTVYSKSIQNITNLLVLWRDSSSNITNVQYAVGEYRYPSDGWTSVLEWTNATENVSNKIIDSNLDYYPDSDEALITSNDYNLSSDDVVVRNGSAALKRFRNGTEMFNCSNGYNMYNVSTGCTIVFDSDGNGKFNSANDSIIGTNYSIVEGSGLFNFTFNITYSDADNDNLYDAGEAIVLDNNTDQKLDRGYLNGSGIDRVLVNSTKSQLYIPLTTKVLNLENHHFYYISIQYKIDSNLFYSLIGSSLSIKYKTSSGGGGNNETNCTGPKAVLVNAALVSESKTLNASWTPGVDLCYSITNYTYTIGTAKYPAAGHDSITGSWINNNASTTAKLTANLADGQTYYWNVKAINSIGQESEVNSSDGTRYYDQVAPQINSWNISNATKVSGVWVDTIYDNQTIINLYGDENMTCFISAYDKGYSNYNSSSDVLCSLTSYPAINLSCNITNLSQGTYSYHAVCQDTSSPITNKNTAENNLDFVFTVNYNDNPTINNLSIWIYDSNLTLRWNTTNISNSTYTNDFLICNGTYYDQDGHSLHSGTLSWKKNGVTISTVNITQTNISISINLSTQGSKSDNITCAYEITDAGTSNNNTVGNYTITINNSKPVLLSTPLINSTTGQNKSNESLICYAPSSSDDDADIVKYTYLWYRNGTLNTTTKVYTNSTTDTLNEANTSLNDWWLCSIIPYDGEQNGTAANSSNLIILNSAPYNNATIPSITWSRGSTASINLNDYFKDVDSQTLIFNYTNTDLQNITVTVDSSTGVATFDSDDSFTGTRTIRFNATDRSSWSGYSNVVTLNVTNSTISVTLIGPANYYNSSSSAVVFTCLGNNTLNNNLTNATIKLNNASDLYYNLTNTTINVTGTGNVSNSTFAVTNIADGTYTWNCYFTDNQSNEGYASSVYTLIVDTVYPRIDFSAETAINYSNFSRTWIYSKVTLSENVKNITFNFNGTLFNYTNQTYHLNNTGLGEGNYSYFVTACDYAGNCNSTQTRFIVLDTTPPSGVRSLTNISTNESSITLNWTVAADSSSGVKEYYIYRNGTFVNSTTNLNYTDNNRLASTNYLYNVSAVDYAGNENRTINISVTTGPDTTPPIFLLLSVTKTQTTSAITWATDDLTNGTLSWSTDQNNLSNSANYSSFATSHTITLSGLSQNTDYYFNITAWNTAALNATNGTNTFKTEATSSVSGSSGGGGGGSSSAGTTNRISLSNSFSGYNVKKNDILEFAFKNATYSLKVTQVTTNYIELLVTQTQYRFTVNVGDTKQVDLNGDGKNDIELKLVSINSQKVANLMIRSLGEPRALSIIPAPIKKPTAPTSDLQPVQPWQPTSAVEPAKPVTGKDNIIPYAIAALMAIAIVGSLVMKEKMRINYIYSQPELRLHDFIKKAKAKGHHIDEIKKALVSNGWPSHTVDSVALHETVNLLLEKGHNHKIVREHLKKKGFNHKVVNDAILHHYISSEIGNRKSIKKIREDLIKAGWDPKIVDKKLPAK
jgi:hypothetical protein